MLFKAENPENHQFFGSWTGAFNTPDVLLNAGSGLALWIDDGTEATVHSPLNFEFPKHDPVHYLYNPDRHPPGNISGTFPVDRGRNGRFVYEEEGPANGNVTLSANSSGDILIGNPFMAHLDFSAFYASNGSVLTSRGYKLMYNATDPSSFYSYVWDGAKYVSTSPAGESNGLIAPMQSFVVAVKDGGGTLTANIRDHTTSSADPEDAFRTAQGTRSPIRQLNIRAVRDTEESRAIVLQDASFATRYVPSEDSYKLFVSNAEGYDPNDLLKHIQVYTLSGDGYALDINFIGTSEQDITVPLGIRTSEKGEIVLRFSGMESFGEETGIYLYDAHRPEQLTDLSEQPEYIFDKTENELYLENCLSLIIGKSAPSKTVGFEEVPATPSVRILSLFPRMLRLISESGEALGAVRITDVEGRVILDHPSVSSPVYEYQVPAPGVYVVRVGNVVRKTVNN
jgi:hypothetical protein